MKSEKVYQKYANPENLSRKKTNEDFNNQQPLSAAPDLGDKASNESSSLYSQTDDAIRQHINSINEKRRIAKGAKINGLKW